ncbi:hypothetical protein BDP67DRAFT_515849, partial [Colletotrichum lupini]
MQCCALCPKPPSASPPVLFGRTSHVPFLWQLWFSFTPSLLARCLSGIIWFWRSLSGLPIFSCCPLFLQSNPRTPPTSLDPGSIAFRTMASI